MDTLRLAVLGAAGRMGRELARAVFEDPATALAGALEREGSPAIGSDVGVLAGVGELGVKVTADRETALANADAVLDFTVPALSIEIARQCGRLGRAHVIGTTGFNDQENQAIAEAARSATIVKSGNMSLGVNLLAVLVREAASALGSDFDIEVVEMHHRHKVDAPSGTALLLGQAAADGRGVDLAAASVRVRDGRTGPRETNTIGFATLRGGSVVGEHSVILAGSGERIELTHVAQDRSLFSRGAVTAAKWAKGRAHGLYSMADVLGLKS